MGFLFVSLLLFCVVVVFLCLFLFVCFLLLFCFCCCCFLGGRGEGCCLLFVVVLFVVVLFVVVLFVVVIAVLFCVGFLLLFWGVLWFFWFYSQMVKISKIYFIINKRMNIWTNGV